jgi:hypothetical protein
MRSMTVLILLIVLVGGGLWYLSTMDVEQPQTRVEKIVPNEKLGK